MRNETRELLGFKVQITGVCDTLAEVIAAAGSEDAVVKDVNAQTLAHSHFTILRRKIVAELVKLTGVKQLVKKVGTGAEAKEVIDEKDAAYIARLEEELGAETLKTHEAAISAVCAGVPVDYKPGTRGSGGSGAPAKKWLAYYDQLVAESKLDLFCERNGINPDGDLSEEDLKIAVATKVKDIVTAQMEAAAKAAMDV